MNIQMFMETYIDNTNNASFLFSLLLLLFTSAEFAHAQEIEPLLPPNVISIKNASTSNLIFYLRVDDDWREFSIRGNAETEIPNTSIYLAIATFSDSDNGSAEIPVNSINMAIGRGDLRNYGVFEQYFVRRLYGGNRWQICWSIRRSAWVVDLIFGDLC